jgi:hypothetical protein
MKTTLASFALLVMAVPCHAEPQKACLLVIEQQSK